MTANDKQREQNQKASQKPTGRQRATKQTSLQSIQIGGSTYQVLEQLSLPSRGRWKVRDRRPPPRGTLYTVIDVPVSAATLQFKDALARLPDHVSGIPRLANCDQWNGRLRMVVSWCAGTDLETYFKRVASGKALAPSIWESIRRVRSLAHLLGALHRRCRVIHGDIKPANLILPSQPGSISLIDFGSSWQIEKTRGRENGDGADVHYSAPEVFQEKAVVDERADQFSAGIILYRLLTGELPYAELGGRAGDPRYREHFENKLELPSSKSAELTNLPNAIRVEIDQLLKRSLSFAPEERFPTTRAFSEALDRIWAELGAAKSPAKQVETRPWWKRLLG